LKVDQSGQDLADVWTWARGLQPFFAHGPLN